MKKTVIIVVLLIIPSIIALSDELRIEWNNGEDSWVNLGEKIWKAQSFTLGTSSEDIDYVLDSVKIKIWRNSDIGEIIVSIQNVDIDGPMGEELSKGVINLSKITTNFGKDGGEWYEIKMSPYKLEKSKAYALVVSVAQNNYQSALSWKGSIDNLYTGGKSFSSTDSGDNWESDNIADYSFEILTVGSDKDQDSVYDLKDNCPNIKNKDQKDTDTDGIGDSCDNCPFTYNPDQTDTNKNKIGNACEISDKNVLIINKLTTKAETLNLVMDNLTKKIDSLEKKVNDLNKEIVNLKNKTNDHEKKINAIQKSVNELKKLFDNFQKKLKDYFRYLTDTHRKQILCSYMKENNIASYEDLGLSCKMSRTRCTCKKV